MLLFSCRFSRQHYVTFRKRWFNHMGTTNGLTLWEFGRSGILEPLLGYRLPYEQLNVAYSKVKSMGNLKVFKILLSIFLFYNVLFILSRDCLYA
ncbi:hypothetical protein Hanom_Chr15g01390791 [Helianthus anomalus]